VAIKILRHTTGVANATHIRHTRWKYIRHFVTAELEKSFEWFSLPITVG